MTSIGTENISRGYTSRLPLFSLVPVYTRITGAPPSPHSSDGDFKFSSLSPYRPSFSNSSRHSTVVLDSFGDVACPPTVGLTIIAAQAWTHALVITLGIVGFAVIILLVMAWIGYEYEKDREAAEHVRKGGEPRNSREREAKFLQNLQEREEAPHILTCSHGIIRYRPK